MKLRDFWDWLTETYRWRCLWDAIRYFPGFLRRLWEYLPMIWHDRDWDYIYILRLLRYKIKRTRDNIKENNNHEDCDKTVADMDHILEVIDRVIECDYCKEDFDAHMAKWGERKMIDSGEGYSTMQPTSEEQRADFGALCDKMNKAEKADWDELWSALSKDLKTFWD